VIFHRDDIINCQFDITQLLQPPRPHQIASDATLLRAGVDFDKLQTIGRIKSVSFVRIRQFRTLPAIRTSPRGSRDDTCAR